MEPEQIDGSEYKITVNGERFDIHQDKERSYHMYNLNNEIYKTVTDHISFAIIPFQDAMIIKIQPKRPFHSFNIRPKNSGVQYSTVGNWIEITVIKPQKLSIEFDNDLSRPLLLFMSEPTPMPLPPRSGKVYYFKAGWHDIGTLQLYSNESVYIEAGAEVYGIIKASQANGITISGQGILNGTRLHRNGNIDRQQMISLNSCSNVIIQGITIFDGPQWHLVPVNCENVLIEDINIISLVPSGDGIDLVGCSNVEIKDCFLKTNDDCVSVKSSNKSGENGASPVKNIDIHHCICWSATHGNVFEIGYELCTEEVCNITFRDSHIIHCEHEGYQSGGVLTIHNGDRALVHHIRYENLTIEDAKEKLIDIKILNSVYSRDEIRGQIFDVLFKNIQIIDGIVPPSIVRGYESCDSIFKVVYIEQNDFHVIRDLNGQGSVRNIVIDGLYVFGKRINNFAEAKMIIEIATDIKFV